MMVLAPVTIGAATLLIASTARAQTDRTGQCSPAGQVRAAALKCAADAIVGHSSTSPAGAYRVATWRLQKATPPYLCEVFDDVVGRQEALDRASRAITSAFFDKETYNHQYIASLAVADRLCFANAGLTAPSEASLGSPPAAKAEQEKPAFVFRDAGSLKGAMMATPH